MENEYTEVIILSFDLTDKERELLQKVDVGDAPMEQLYKEIKPSTRVSLVVALYCAEKRRMYERNSSRFA